MRLISSKLTFYYKRIFPLIFFGVLLVIFVAAAATGFEQGGSPAPALGLLPMIFIGAFGYYFMRRLVFDLVDEVSDEGGSLLVRNGGREDRIAFSDVMNVSYSPYMNPPRVTLLLRRPSAFGDRIAFVAPMQWMPFAASPVVEELIRRIDAKRRAATTR